ncbi:MAG: hypothetical protein ACREFK_19600 [Stellaceae bacterium]
MTCPACGYFAPLAVLRARPVTCPACGRRLNATAAWGPLIFTAPPAVAFLLCWQAGLRGAWLVAAGVAATAPAYWMISVLLIALWPPHLLVREPRHRAAPTASGPWPYEPVITLGLSAPPPEPQPSEPPPTGPPPDNGAATPHAATRRH